jgi:hypothetical protein
VPKLNLSKNAKVCHGKKAQKYVNDEKKFFNPYFDFTALLSYLSGFSG